MPSLAPKPKIFLILTENCWKIEIKAFRTALLNMKTWVCLIYFFHDCSILPKNGSFSNKTCCGLTALFLKTKIYFCHCNFVNKQKKKFLLSFFCIDCSSQYVEPKIFQKMFVALERELQVHRLLPKIWLCNMKNW